MKIFRLPIVFFILIFAATGSFAQTGVLRTERSQSSVVTFVEGADIIGLSSSHFIDGYVRRYGKDRFIFPVGHGTKAGPFAGDGSGIIGAYYAENPGASTLVGGPFAVSTKAAEIQSVSQVEYWHIDGAEPTTLSLTWNTNSGIAGLTGNALNKLSVVGWSSANKRWEIIPSQVDAVALLGGSSTLTSGSISTARAIIPDQYDVFTLAGLTSGAAPSDYAGKLETADCRAISGWVYDKNNTASEVVVELVDGTKVYGQAIASNFRADLKANGIGTGKYGFSIPLPEDARDGNYRNLSIRVRGTNFSLEGSPKIVGCGYRGKFESADCYTVKGWTVIGEYPDSSLVVDLLADGQFQGSYAANIYRSDVQALVGGNGKVGFEFQLPGSVKTNTPRQLSLRAKNSKFVLDDSPKTVQCAEPQTFGSFEVANCSALTGWVWDKIYPANALTVEILEGNAVVATGLANIYRADLKAGGFGTGNYAFSIPYPEALKDGRNHQLTARVKGSNYMLVGSRTVNCLLEIYGGAFETAECNAIRGWAWDKSHPDAAMTVELLADGAVVATAVANTYREDLKSAGNGTGNYGFSIPVPNNLKDARPHSYSVRIQGTTYVLGGSPRTMTCAVPSQYGGGFETANCSALTGWVWDKIYPESALTVEILEGTTVVATGLANIYRADLKAAGYGTGNYVFSIPLPEALKDGVSHQLSVRVKGSNYMVGSAKTVNCLLEIYEGAFETADCNAIRGWAWDKNHPDLPMTVELLADGAVVATSVANNYRQDLKNAGTGTGNYGFSIPLPNNLKDAQAHSYTVRIQGTTYVLGGSPRSMTCALPSQYGGGFETANCSVITGWVWDKTYPETALTVEVLEGTTVVASGLANIYRADLKAAGFGTGNYVFSIPLPDSLKDGVAHQLSVRVKGSNYMVGGTSKTVNCLLQIYGGAFEAADCNTIRGWAWDKNHPNAAMTVELLADGAVVATSVANTYREDLKTAGTGTGNYGFSIALPNNMKDAQAHSYSVRIQGTTYMLGGSPRSMSCALPSQYGGGFETASCSNLTGWVWDKTYPATALTVEVLEGTTVVASGLANIYRADLKAAGFGTGNYVFNIPLPDSLKDGVAHQLSVRVKGSNYVIGGTSKTVNCLLQIYGGAFEAADCNTIRGWAWDKSHPNAAMTVELLADGAVVATSVANAYREDLKTAGTGTGNYGFSIALPNSIKDAQAHSYSVRIQGTTYVLGGSPRSMTCALPSQYGGGFETANCTNLTGWVWDKTYPANALTVEILEGTTVVATGLANIYRADLKSAGYGTGNYAFSIPLPEALKDGVAHQLSVRVKGSNYMVGGTSKTVNCLLQIYGGAFEAADCNTIRGWAWDKSHPNTAVTVELLADGAVVATSVANAYREDLKTAGTGTGNYGFSIALPNNMKDAQAHSYSVRIQGTTYVLGGSPRSMTCALPSQYGGGFETASCSTITGWVWDKTYPANALTVEILEGTTVVATGLANIYRADLKSAGYGTGNYAFSIPLPEALKDGVSHQLSVRVKGSNYMVGGTSKTVSCLLQVYNGAFESADCSAIRGWAWDKSHPNTAVTVELLADGAVVATSVANAYREDLKTAGTGTGNYGFSIALPNNMKDAQAHSYSVRIQGTTYVLGGSPRSMTCALPSQYGGGFETANCTNLTGWVWDKTYPANALTVEILEGTTVVASGLANIYRADLKSAGYGTGNYAFSIPLPEALKDGVSHQLSVRVKGSNYMVGSAKTVNCLLQVYNGAFESADCNTIRGWAWDKSHPNTAVTVELLADGAVVATSVANTYREDLKTAGTGTGNYGFSIALPNNMKDAQAHSYSVRIQGTTYVLGGSPRSMTCALPSQYGGGFETASCSTITGWVWDKTYPANALTVEILEGTTVVATGLANIYRADLKSAGYGTGNYAFSIPLPEALKDGVSHQLSVRVKGSNYMVGGTSKTVSCLLQVYNGAFESADCSAIRGWAWDKSHPNTAVTVELLADGAVVATSVANAYREDLKTAGTGTGNYGFSIALPNNMKDAQAHSYSVRIQGTTYVLGGSPRSMTCALPSQYGGGFETANCTNLTGWVWDKTYPANALTVEILEGTTVVASGLANIYRADLKSAGYGTGNYAFSIPLPEALKDGVSHQLSVRVKGSNYMVGGTSKTVSCLLQVYNGAFESADCSAIRGWAWDKSHPNAAMTVELLADGAVVATSVANAYREDLKTAGTGTGNYGFSIALPNNMKDAQAHSYSVRIQGTTYVLGGSPRSMTCALPSQFAGSFETAGCTVFTGWVWDKTYPANALTVEILEAGTVVASGVANGYRADLKSAGLGTGNYAFSIPVPAALKDGRAHQLTARVKGSTYLLGNSPRTMTCATQARTASPEDSVSHNEADQLQLTESIRDLDLAVYPNPTKGKVVAQFHLGYQKEALVSVTNLLGQVVWTKSMTGEGEEVKVDIELEENTAGVYLIQLRVGNQTKLKRVVLVK